MQHNGQQIDQVLQEYFRAQVPVPFPKAPMVHGGTKARNFSGLSSRFALAASMLILFGLGIFWPKNTQTANNINFKTTPASASDDKRHKLPLINLKEDNNSKLQLPLK
ncbi:MAG: hypothetical protein EBT92_08195 [Planctomycetes bacterium]|nr:hypothetical protein [Planctomycetota bacterium]NBY01226.1 hypothetical protein [Planctomycetota bacterium]